MKLTNRIFYYSTVLSLLIACQLHMRAAVTVTSNRTSTQIVNELIPWSGLATTINSQDQKGSNTQRGLFSASAEMTPKNRTRS